MTGTLIGVGAFALILGLFLTLGGARGLELPSAPKLRIKIAPLVWVAAAIGLALAIVTRFYAAAILVPGMAAALPRLLREPVNREVEILAALDRWIRLLAASLPTGKSIPDAIRATYAQCPAPLVDPVGRVITRLNHRWTLREALLAMSDELDSQDADAVLAALIMSSERGGVGAAATLSSLADSCAYRLHALRDIEAERAKPRIVVRQVTIITIVVLAAGMIFGGSYFRSYLTPAGQLLAVSYAALYLGALLILQRMATPRQKDRFLAARPVMDDV